MTKQVQGANTSTILRHLLPIAAVLLLVAFFMAPVAAADATPDLTITDLQGLKDFAAAVNNGDTFAGKTVVLANDITFAADDYWYSNDGTTVVDHQIKNFAGTFDGQNHKIIGMKYSTTVKPSTTWGLFGTIDVGGSVKNLTLDTVTADVSFSSDTLWRGTFGFIAFNLKGDAENCHVKKVTVTTNEYSALREGGGMFSNVMGTTTDCTGEDITIDVNYDGINLNSYSLEDAGCLFGTVVGKTSGCTLTKAVIDLGDAGYSKKVGGFTGKIYGGATVENCAATDVTMSAYYLYYAGGFVGHCEKGSGTDTAQSITNCFVTDVDVTTIRGTKIVGGFVGEAANGAQFNNCDAADVTMDLATGVADGTVTSKNQGALGGFCGQTNTGNGRTTTFDGCDLTGLDMTVAGDLEGGIGAFIASTGASATFTSCSAEGTIDATNTEIDDAVGGFIGNLGWGGSPAIDITGTSANVDIEANGPAGGFVAKSDSNSGTATPSLTISASTATGSVTSISSTADGFVGTGNLGTLTNCVPTGKVTLVVTLNANDGSSAIEQSEVSPGDTVTLANPFDRSGYTISGWSLTEDGTESTYAEGQPVEVTKSLNLYAIWTLDQPTVTVKAENDTTNITLGETIKLTATVTHGLTEGVVGQWYNESDNIVISGETGTTLTVTSLTKTTKFNYTVTVTDSDGKTEMSSASVTIHVSKKETVNAEDEAKLNDKINGDFKSQFAGKTVHMTNITLIGEDGREDHNTEITFVVTDTELGIPAGTSSNYNFVVLHLEADGTTITPVTNFRTVENGLEITSKVSPFAIGYSVKPVQSSSGSQGSSIWLTETQTPTSTPTVTETPTDSVPTDIPVTQPTATPSTPGFGILAVLTGFGAVVAFRRK